MIGCVGDLRPCLRRDSRLLSSLFEKMIAADSGFQGDCCLFVD